SGAAQGQPWTTPQPLPPEAAARTGRIAGARRLSGATPAKHHDRRGRTGMLPITSVGVIGLGSVGCTVARRLLDQGLDVIVHDSDAWTVATMAAAGATPARIPADAAEPADLVFVHLPDESAVEEVLFDCGGIGETLRDGCFVVAASDTGPGFLR